MLFVSYCDVLSCAELIHVQHLVNPLYSSQQLLKCLRASPVVIMRITYCHHALGITVVLFVTSKILSPIITFGGVSSVAITSTMP